MLINNKEIKGLVVRATDGELGTVNDLYFDDESWGIRYLTVETGNWMSDRPVLISPMAILQVDWTARRMDVSLTRKQVEQSPSIDTHKPVSRQHEMAYLGYYGYPYYWDGPYLWGPVFFPSGPVPATVVAKDGPAEERPIAQILPELPDLHLRSIAAVSGYHMEAKDGPIGHLNQVVVDDEVWAIRYLEVDTRNWWPGKKVLLPPAWVERVSWEESKIYVAATREKISSSPEFQELNQITRAYENKLYFHYGRPPYWLEERELKQVFGESKAVGAAG